MSVARSVPAGEVRIRDFRPTDIEACLTVFDSNVPDFFLVDERAEFRAFLETLPGPYLVVEWRGAVIGCGGHAVRPEERTADLCWGMVARELHGRGVGRLMTRARIQRASEEEVTSIALNTSQHTAAFYRGFGFETVEVVPDGYGAGLDRHEMRLRLPSVRLLDAGDLHLFERVADDVFDGPIRMERAVEFLEDGRHHIAVAVHADVMVGFASAIHYVHPDKEPELWIAEVGVAPAHRRLGLASRLIGVLRNHAKTLGCGEVWVLTERGNEPAVALYRSTGGVEAKGEAVLFSWTVS